MRCKPQRFKCINFFLAGCQAWCVKGFLFDIYGIKTDTSNCSHEQAEATVVPIPPPPHTAWRDWVLLTSFIFFPWSFLLWNIAGWKNCVNNIGLIKPPYFPPFASDSILRNRILRTTGSGVQERDAEERESLKGNSAFLSPGGGEGLHIFLLSLMTVLNAAWKTLLLCMTAGFLALLSAPLEEAWKLFLINRLTRLVPSWINRWVT